MHSNGADDGSVATRDTARIHAELLRLQAGDRAALDALLPMLFEPLRRVARAQRARVNGGETLRTTALIHEAYLKLRRSGELAVQDEAHFLNIAARAMRQILIDHARSRIAAREREVAAGEQGPQTLLHRQAVDLLAINAAVERLEAVQPRLMQIVLYRFFAGYTEDETANLLGINARTVRRGWLKAKALLIEDLQDRHDPPS